MNLEVRSNDVRPFLYLYKKVYNMEKPDFSFIGDPDLERRMNNLYLMLEEEERERSNYQKAISSLSSAASVPMGIIFCSEYPSKSTFDLRSLNQDLL